MSQAFPRKVAVKDIRVHNPFYRIIFTGVFSKIILVSDADCMISGDGLIMNNSLFDILAIGNAIVDIVTYVDDDFLSLYSLSKGTMYLVDIDRAEYLCSKILSKIESSGGSAANTAVGISALGGQVALIGKVADDRLGRTFTRDMKASGVYFSTRPLLKGLPTAYSLVLVTPDAQRTMNTYLGACLALQPDDIDLELVRHAQIIYLEGYQWDLPYAQKIVQKVAHVALTSGSKIALSLSDFLCVDRHRAVFRDWVRSHVNILFANETEITSLYQVLTFDEALQAARYDCSLIALTRGSKGSVVATPKEVHVVPSYPVAHVMDTTGAGDMFAAGFLYGLIHEQPVNLCARLGNLCAAEVVSYCGGRPLIGRQFFKHMKNTELL